MRKRQVVIIGSSSDSGHMEEAYQIGRRVAEMGCVLISGGRGGIMSAASRGARECGGITVGILPSEEMDEANEFCSIVIPTGIGYARNSMNILSGDIIIAMEGGAGTLTELAYAWQYGKTVICCTFCGGWSRIFAEISPDQRAGSRLLTAASLDQVYEHLDTMISAR
ncbi:MAG: TIGR00725 family protein [Spirochaetes bacterium]|nr:TIGR00725 family protein [Spirochaetota bacterium]